MSVAVLVPWRGGDPYREAAWEYVQTRLRTYDCFIADSPLPLFNRAAALTMALAQTDADVLCLVDADSMVSSEALIRAVEMAREAPGLVIGYVDALYLTQPETLKVYQGFQPFSWRPETDEESHDHSVGGVVVLSRETIEGIGGFHDPIFKGWGAADRAMAYLSERLYGPVRRVEGALWHLHHPWRREARYWQMNKQLAEAYKVTKVERLIKRRKDAWERLQQLGTESTTASPTSSATSAPTS